ncbi:enoyl-CoA hydratase/isomerase family protein [Desulforhopalus singaporensis]|uniref:3-hydroxypropionyl-CoA dehydratase n=1 Tax=Desulforhopalus singaporensis TaxID=91360 RepID=A0A1H0V009_9BACT|nr:enoyl-CoA hydratase-related protein [Desulforhopalus singaporensis]SDP71777.1 3-hydroxypropionyl-CoA dehydratase [Desulforhopalus singaporensis]
MASKTVLLKQENGIGWIRFNRPEKLNALNSQVFKELEEAVAACEEADEIRVVILTGSEKAFVAGADIDQMADADVTDAARLGEISMRAQERLAYLAKPTIAMISGYALGGGLEVALCCDFRIAADNAVLGLPEITLGIIPGGGGTQRLSRLISYSNAAELIMTGEMIKADQAEKLGILNRVVDPGALEDEVKAFASKLIKQPAMALRAAKTAMRRGLEVSLKDGLYIEQDCFCMLFSTADQKEGMKAFMEKRKPLFKGC